MGSIFKDGNEPINLLELNRVNAKETRDLLLLAIRRSLVFHGAEQDISDEAAFMLCDEIIYQYGYISLPEFCYVINRNLKDKKYGQLCAADILRWVAEYDAGERNEAIHANQKDHKPTYTGNEVGYDEWIESVMERAEKGDEEAIKILANQEKINSEAPLNKAICKAYREVVRSTIYKREKQQKEKYGK